MVCLFPSWDASIQRCSSPRLSRHLEGNALETAQMGFAIEPNLRNGVISLPLLSVCPCDSAAFDPLAWPISKGGRFALVPPKAGRKTVRNQTWGQSHDFTLVSMFPAVRRPRVMILRYFKPSVDLTLAKRISVIFLYSSDLAAGL